MADPDRPGDLIKRAEAALLACKTRALRPLGLTVPQYAALLVLTGSDGMSATQLARRCLVAPQTMSKVLANLEAKGLVDRRPSELHHKVVVATVTSEGRAVLAHADRAALRIERALAAEFDDRELVNFQEYLERVIREFGGSGTERPT